jgi:sodium/bile acid cotransporter 7
MLRARAVSGGTVHVTRRGFAPDISPATCTRCSANAALRRQKLPQRAAAFVKRNWFTLSLPPMVAFSSCYSDMFRDRGVLQFQNLKDWCVAGIFLSTGLALPVVQMKAVLSLWRVHAFVQAGIFLGAPLAFSASAPCLRAAGLPEPLVMGWMLLGCLPTSIGISLALTRVANGEVAVTLLNSAASNLMGVALVPWLCVFVTGVQPSIDASAVVGKLLKIVAAPALLGMALRHGFPVVGRYDPMFRIMQSACLLPVLAHVFSNAFAQHSAQPGFELVALVKLLAAAAMMNVFLMVTSHAMSTALRIEAAPRVATYFLASQKTAAMGVPMIATMFAGDPNLGLYTLPLLCYHPVQAGVGGIYAGLVRLR